MTQGLPPPRAGLITQEVAANVTKVQEIGGLAGRVALAYLAVVIVSRRKLIRLFQIPGLIVMPLTFAVAATTSLNWLYLGMFLAGFFTVGQFSFWGNYLPRVYPLYLRGTGESFAANIGGRLIGTSFAWLTATLAVTPDRAYAPTKVALCRCGRRIFGVPRRLHRELLAARTAEGKPAGLMRHALIGALLIAAVSTARRFRVGRVASAAPRRLRACRTAPYCFFAWAPISDLCSGAALRGALVRRGDRTHGGRQLLRAGSSRRIFGDVLRVGVRVDRAGGAGAARVRREACSR